MTILKIATRVLAFVGKEIVTTLRRPAAIFSLILGPFLIMALFGYGYNGFRRPADTIVVLPQGNDLPRDPAYYAELGGPPVNIVAVTDDEAGARARLQAREVQLVVIAPADAEAQFLAGKQAEIKLVYDEVDPVMVTYVNVLGQEFGSRVNQQLIAAAVKQGEAYVAGSGTKAAQIPPDVVAAPTKVDPENLAPTAPGVTAFFAPAVLALILQHMAVTLTALSLVRERTSGAMELYRVTPTSALDILVGKYIAFGVLNLLVAFAVTALILAVFHVPILANLAFIGLVVGLLTFASLGLGMLISALADSERQSVQLSLLALLAAVFFSGFVAPLRDFDPVVRNLAYLLPVTHGIALLQDAFLRGVWVPWHLLALALIGSVLFVATGLLLNRSMRAV
jgi:ABC-2 type transport system permease protein